MNKVEISELKAGMKLAKDVYLPDGRILLLSGFVVKERYIRKLELFKVPYVYVMEGELAKIENISEEKVYSEAFHSIKSVMTSVREGKELDIKAVRDTVSCIVHKVINNETVFMQLTGIRDIDNYTFLHSVDVCIYSVITGRKLGYSDKELTELGIGAVLHDIGKCKIPNEILLKPGRLTKEEFEVMKKHSIFGYDIVINTPGLSKKIANIAYQHHEKWNGSGYPAGLSGNDIDSYARIVTAADIYDALTADRVYRKRDMPHMAAEYIVANSSVLIDPEIAKVFIKNITIYPEGAIVLMNTGEIGCVIEANTNMSLRPKVRVIARKEGPPVLDTYVRDLMQELDVFIIDILS